MTRRSLPLVPRMTWLAQCRILGVLFAGLLLVSNSGVIAAMQRPRPWDALRIANARLVNVLALTTRADQAVTARRHEHFGIMDLMRI